jgi:hypothetical protein
MIKVASTALTNLRSSVFICVYLCSTLSGRETAPIVVDCRKQSKGKAQMQTDKHR